MKFSTEMRMLLHVALVTLTYAATPISYSSEQSSKTLGRAIAATKPMIYENMKFKLAEWVQEHPYFAAPPADAIEALLVTADPSLLEKYLGLAFPNHTEAVAVDLKQRQEYILHRLGQLCEASTHLPHVGVKPDCAAQLSYIACSVTPLTLGVFGYLSGMPNASEIVGKYAWILNYFDSFGKMPAGVSDGNFLWLGDYLECVDILQKIVGNGITLRGKHCSVDLRPKIAKSDECSPVSATVGICVPQVCSANDINFLVKAIDQPLGSNTLFCDPHATCHETEPPKDWSFILAIVLLCLVVLLITVATAYDLLFYQPKIAKATTTMDEQLLINGEKTKRDEIQFETMAMCELDSKLAWYGKILLSFSIYTNGARLLNTGHNRNELAPLHGIRFITMAWVILAHTYLFATDYITNQNSILVVPQSFFFMIVNNATLSTDTFFLLSGFLLTYYFFKAMKNYSPKLIKCPKFWIRYVLHRYFRLTPVYLTVVFLVWALWDHFGDGPMYAGRDVTQLLENCRQNYWQNLLYINNYWPIMEQCAGHTWFLAVDFQLYLVAAPFLAALFIIPVATSVILIVGIVISCITRAFVMVNNDLPMAPIATVRPDIWHQRTIVYDKVLLELPWMRFSSFVVGIILAVIIHKYRPTKNAIPKVATPIIWLVILILIGITIFLPYNFARTGYFAPAFGIIYCAIFRTIWSLAVAAALFMCLQKRGGKIVAFLSTGIWAPLSRLSYCAFLIHPFVILFYFTFMQAPGFFTHFDMLFVYWAILLSSYALALVISLLFEEPIRQIEKRLWPSDSSTNL